MWFCFLGSTKCKKKIVTTGGDYSNMMSTEIKLPHVIWKTCLVNGTLLRKVSIALKPDHTKNIDNVWGGVGTQIQTQKLSM